MPCIRVKLATVIDTSGNSIAGGTSTFSGVVQDVLGTGNQGRPYFNLGRTVRVDSWGDRLKTNYQSMQIALNKPFTHGLLFKGAYTLSKSMNQSDSDGRATLSWNTPSELGRNYAPAGFDRRHNFQLGFAYSLPWQSNGGSYGNVAKAIVSDWQINGVLAAFSGSPFLVSASNTSLNTPSNQQTADLIGTYTILGNIGAYQGYAAVSDPHGSLLSWTTIEKGGIRGRFLRKGTPSPGDSRSSNTSST